MLPPAPEPKIPAPKKSPKNPPKKSRPARSPASELRDPGHLTRTCRCVKSWGILAPETGAWSPREFREDRGSRAGWGGVISLILLLNTTPLLVYHSIWICIFVSVCFWFYVCVFFYMLLCRKFGLRGLEWDVFVVWYNLCLLLDNIYDLDKPISRKLWDLRRFWEDG